MDIYMNAAIITGINIDTISHDRIKLIGDSIIAILLFIEVFRISEQNNSVQDWSGHKF